MCNLDPDRLGHDHPGQVAMYGSCLTCDRAEAVVAVPGFGGRSFRPHLDAPRLTSQLQRVANAVGGGAWQTLAGIAERVGAPEASVSARLRDLRKWGWTVERRRFTPGTWQYRATPPA